MPRALRNSEGARVPGGGHSVPEGETRETRVTKGYARAVPQRLRDAVSKLEKGRLLTFSKPQKVAGDVETVCGHHRGIKRGAGMLPRLPRK